ncbi:MAG: ATP-binding cassette domain-containing protein [Lachnospiraceae bacterium]|nr:ATP-binding cassette domain-containing protein [Lachnospiraceae bacterium]
MEIVIQHLTKTINKVTVLEDVNMKLCSGHIYGFQGENGSGKTMLLRAISGLLCATSGKIVIDGQVLGKDISFPPNLGIMLENPAFIDSYTGYDNLKLLASIRRKNPDIKQVLEQVGLAANDKRKYRKYSLGMKQRLGIACAIMENPDLLILDEPFNALDQTGQDKLAEILLKKKEEGCLILLTAHDKDVLERLSDELFLVSKGRFERKAKECLENASSNQ